MISEVIKRFIFITSAVLVFTYSAQAQLVNSGDLYVKEGAVLYSAFTLENQTTGRFINDGTLILKSDLTNNGLFGFSPNLSSGLTRLEGLSNQSISGSSEFQFWNLNLDNGQGFSLENNLRVFGSGEFNSGIVVSDPSDPVFGFGIGGISQNSSDESFVDGKVGTETDSDFFFPVGDEQFLRFLRAAPAAGGDNLNLHGRYFFEDPDGQYPRDQIDRNIRLIDDAEYWELENLNTGETPMALTLSWRDVTTPAFILGELNQMSIVSWDDAQQLWVSEGGVIDTNEQIITADVEFAGDGVFTLGILVGKTDLSIAKTSFGESIWEGDEFEYELTLQNNSQVVATDVVLVDNLPAGLEYISVEGESIFGLLDFEVEVIGQTVIIRIPEFIGGDEATFRLRVRASDPGRIINVAEVESFEEDENLEDNVDTDENEVKAFFIPNVITPNNDGFNDQFEIKGLNKFISNKITIFNRWGDTLLETDNYGNDWKGEGLVAGTYFYTLEVVEEDGSDQTFKGWIQIIRED
ncbi:gliding motility-associated C-terminal domain-containing protein [Algoriphagus sediminis]|uniref:Gliding motility-associated C-terminal domain-containing protein n=1 Tax=Algoriphagus sediminis TaxID=3057113 RepID=A0ABT7YGL7_9BACT|nr:gliding motility-associated C-terminal domain-containing protein [Algoriphagus sediminis]MDN3205485.1 gliding motility-associated C-terminal domain-containing protein [Algoriphagus sediminis]